VAVLAAYGRILPKRILEQFPLGIINVHPSLLPHYRGTSPIEQAIIDGVKKTGVSIMRLTEDMDEGPLLRQESIILTGNETKQELTELLQKLGAKLIVQELPNVINNKSKFRRQPHPERATYTKKINKSDGLINWNKSAHELVREIRAYAGWPGSRTTLNSISVTITKAHTIPNTSKQKSPGDMNILVKEGRLMVQTSTDYLCIDSIKPDSKKEMSTKAFLAGYDKYLA
jgi:methionyl-tRNA formyltransferase